MNKFCVLIVGVFISSFSNAQDIEETFNGTRILNGHSIETLEKKNLQVRIEHRFGNLMGNNDPLNNSLNFRDAAEGFFGFDEAADIRLGVEYGILDNLMVGIGRSKGTGKPYNSLLDGFIKYRLLTQNKEKGIPVSVAAFASTTLTYQKAVMDISVVQSFPEFQHRMAYCTQIHIARKFNERFSMALVPTYVHRNLVLSNDVNGLFALGAAFSVKILKEWGFVGEYYKAFHDEGLRPDNYDSLSGGIEWVTSGHNFKLVLTNSKGLGETQFIPYTFSDWQESQFRIGFSITRNFQL